MRNQESSGEDQARGSRRGPKGERGAVAERILTAARDSFAAHGYAATTMQGVARAADVDTKLVRYYFRSKESLLAECLTLPADFLNRLRTLSDLPPGQRGQAAVRAHLAAWADPDLARIMRTSLLIAAHEPVAMAQVQATFVDGLIPAITGGIAPGELPIRSGLIASQMLGLAFARFIYAIEPTASIPDQQIVAAVGSTIQRYLDGAL